MRRVGQNGSRRESPVLVRGWHGFLEEEHLGAADQKRKRVGSAAAAALIAERIIMYG